MSSPPQPTSVQAAVPAALAELESALTARDAAFVGLADAFVAAWLPQRSVMENMPQTFAHEPLASSLVAVEPHGFSLPVTKGS